MVRWFSLVHDVDWWPEKMMMEMLMHCPPFIIQEDSYSSYIKLC